MVLLKLKSILNSVLNNDKELTNILKNPTYLYV